MKKKTTYEPKKNNILKLRSYLRDKENNGRGK